MSLDARRASRPRAPSITTAVRHEEEPDSEVDAGEDEQPEAGRDARSLRSPATKSGVNASKPETSALARGRSPFAIERSAWMQIAVIGVTTRKATTVGTTVSAIGGVGS